MNTRKPTVPEQQAYADLSAASSAAQAVSFFARVYFYGAGKASWLPEHADEAEAHTQACKAWAREQETAGFVIAQSGLRVITKR